MRYSPNLGSVAVARLASKSKASILCPSGVTATMASASRRVNGSRERWNSPVFAPTSANERVRLSVERETSSGLTAAEAAPEEGAGRERVSLNAEDAYKTLCEDV